MKNPAVKNVLLISVDQWRAEALGFLGNAAAQTPNFARLAARGVTFRQHVTSSSPCGPARATLLTGLYPFIHRSITNGTPLDSRHQNIALVAREHGYDPVLFGYTDTSHDFRDLAADDHRCKTFEGVLPGFRQLADCNENFSDGWINSLRDNGYDVPEKNADIYKFPGTQAHYDTFPRLPARYQAEHSDTAYINDQLLAFLQEQQGAAEPWFVHHVMLRPHPPLIAPAPYHELIDEALVGECHRASTLSEQAAQHPYLAQYLSALDGPNTFQSQVNPLRQSMSGIRAMRAVYYGLIAEIDCHIGRILDQLEQSGDIDNTLIVFTSDHGEMFGDHWLWGKNSYHQGANRIPLIISHPAMDAALKGHEVMALTESVDVMPTILEAMNLPVPQQLNGVSLLPWCFGATPTQWRAYQFFEFDFRNVETLRMEQALGLTPDQCTFNTFSDGRYKYVHFTALPALFFDLQQDPHEQVNRIDDPAYQSIIQHFAQCLLSHRMLHAERTLTNYRLSAQGVLHYSGDRGLPAMLACQPPAAKPIDGL